MVHDDDYDDGSASVPRRVLTAGALLGTLAVGWLVARPAFESEDAETFVPPTTTAVAASSESAATDPPIDTRAQTARPASVGFDGTSTTESATTPARAPAQRSTTTDAPTTVAPTTTAATTTTTGATTTTVAAASYATTPDGLPEPVIAIFDVSQITLDGTVPDQAASDRLTALAIANSKTPATVINNLAFNPQVPPSVGVRVIELTSSRFPDGSAEVRPEHAVELDRVANVMNALPNVTVTVIGHADQRGDELGNYDLSAERARAVVNYLVTRGIAADRLSSRAVGESDLLTLNNDAAAFALNRRTEFIFYGLLLG